MTAMTHTVVPVVLLALALPASARRPRVTTRPSPVVLGETAAVEIRVGGMPGTGPVRAAVNVGSIDAIEPTVDGALLRYAPPANRAPQVLALLFWRESAGSEVHLQRIALSGQAVIPIRTRRHSQVRVVVGKRRYGPLHTSRQGRAEVEVTVAPGIREAEVEVVDTVGMRSLKTIAIEQAEYPRVSLALLAEGPDRLRVVVGAAEPGLEPRLELDGAPLSLHRRGPLLWEARRSVNPGELARARAWLPGGEAVASTAELLMAGDATPAVVVKRPAGGPAPAPRRVQGVAGLSVGLLHNTGALVSPRIAVEVGLDLRLPLGWIGLRGIVGASWASQSIAASGGLEGGESTVLLLPLGGGLCYRLPLPPLTPYVLVGAQAQMVRTVSTTPLSEGEQRSVEWGPALLALAGAERELGPGLLFFQAGFLWGRVDSAAVEMLAGGVVLEAGYRFRL